MALTSISKQIRHNVEVDVKTPGFSLPQKSEPTKLPEISQEQKNEQIETKSYTKAIEHQGEDKQKKGLDTIATIEAKEENLGIAGDKLPEAQPKFIEAPCEVVYQNANGSYIILGRDRPGSRLSGYGGLGDTKASSIDIVVGRMGSEARKVDENNEQLYIDPSFKKDAARIYISQKSDIDSYFDLSDGSVGNSKTKSAIALKADGIRIVAREGIKLVTGTDQKNSQGGAVKTTLGIDLIAGNDDKELQSMVKGENLKEALERLTHHVDKLAGILDAFLHAQMEYNADIASHFHTSPFFAIPTLPSEVLVPRGAKTNLNLLTKVKRSLVNLKMNLASYKITFLNIFGKKYINSRHNKTT